LKNVLKIVKTPSPKEEYKKAKISTPVLISRIILYKVDIFVHFLFSPTAETQSATRV